MTLESAKLAMVIVSAIVAVIGYLVLRLEAE
jgi:hypothetical protein